ncbi:TetR/AcrR family transcriptional regulator [Actinoplanes sp. TRM 88003]|uniref:TetR/AcrR family transcriptional regulator n=1 Tax=Paractinoplanes aksuensis TaxID=2939490 RepID=A0ABT1DJ95_9ACTN|nr:TetR/AcrR family transcriptional regulator [Actinoplanes aksuensis]MCO8270870.1 TetR/AcrR family transcriptional regulator [Actinoplanes aksuensis]
MARTKDPAIRLRLIERAAQMLRAREPITLRSVVADTGLSTMAVYTYFGSMDGLWRAMRQEGFTRLAARLAAVAPSADPVRDLAALGAAYVSNALAHPDLYRVMFDSGFDLEDPAAADEGLLHFVRAVERAREAGRFPGGTDAPALATRTWIVGHGLASLTAAGPLPREALSAGPALLTAVFVDAGDDPVQCGRSVAEGWTL